VISPGEIIALGPSKLSTCCLSLAYSSVSQKPAALQSEISFSTSIRSELRIMSLAAATVCGRGAEQCWLNTLSTGGIHDGQYE
jgi:hypothetical protein